MASPSNRLVTGPLEKFTTIVRQETYAPLTAPRLTMMGTPDIKESEAHVMVSIVDEEDNVHAYIFVLERQAQAPYANCWMTEGVFQALPASSAPSDISDDQVKET